MTAPDGPGRTGTGDEGHPLAQGHLRAGAGFSVSALVVRLLREPDLTEKEFSDENRDPSGA